VASAIYLLYRILIPHVCQLLEPETNHAPNHFLSFHSLNRFIDIIHTEVPADQLVNGKHRIIIRVSIPLRYKEYNDV